MRRLSELMSLHGRRALITGGAGHIATAMAETLAEMGADLVLLDVDQSKLDDLSNRLTKTYDVHVSYVSCDLENDGDRFAAIQAVQANGAALDILINNAAFVGTSVLEGWTATFDRQSLAAWRRALEVNLTAVFHLSQALAPLLSASGHGTIINIGSIYGEMGPDWSLYDDTGMANPAAYSTSKGGVLQLTRWLATTVKPDIRVNAISPGGVERGQPEKFVSRYVKRTPLGRMATEDDFRGAIAYLASDMSAYMTGQVLRVDGGWGVW